MPLFPLYKKLPLKPVNNTSGNGAEDELFRKCQAGMRETAPSKKGRLSRASLTFPEMLVLGPIANILLFTDLSGKFEFTTLLDSRRM